MTIKDKKAIQARQQFKRNVSLLYGLFSLGKKLSWKQKVKLLRSIIKIGKESENEPAKNKT